MLICVISGQKSSSDSIVKIYNHKIEFYNPGRLPSSISIDDLLTNNYKSAPRNKLIADFCKSLGLIEKYGSGIRRIIDYFEKEKLPMPIFQNISEGFMVTVFSKDNVVDNVVDNEQMILKLIVDNTAITSAEISHKTKLSERLVQRYIKSLKNKGLLLRIGPDNGGYWKIT